MFIIETLIQVEAGSRDRYQYDEITLTYQGIRRALFPSPYPYGLIIGTTSTDGDCMDRYVITDQSLTGGSIVDCQPAGLLEIDDNGEADHKVVAALPGQDMALDQELLIVLRDFTEGVFAQYPDMTVHVDPILPKVDAIDYINSHLSH